MKNAALIVAERSITMLTAHVRRITSDYEENCQDCSCWMCHTAKLYLRVALMLANKETDIKTTRHTDVNQ